MKLHFSHLNALILSIMTCALLAHDGAQGYKWADCHIIPKKHKESSHHISHPHIPAPRTSRVPSNQAASTNWAGYVVATDLNNPLKDSVSAVSGSWIVPTLEPTMDDSDCAFWVGIDGYGSPTVEQIGTEHDWANGMQQDYAWFEMYPGPSYLIGGFPMNPGDVISASVMYIGNNTFVLTLVNDTQKVLYTIPTQYTKSSVALRESAEWIIEAPYLNGILPLSDFVTGYMWGCMTKINGTAGPIGSSLWQNVGLEMITDYGMPKATTSELLPDKGSFFVTWQHE